MKRPGPIPRAAARGLARPVRDLRASHPVRRLRIMRNLMLASVISTLLLCLGTAAVAHHRISAAIQTEQAMAYIDDARIAVQDANDKLAAAFQHGDPSLTRTGADFGNDTSEAGQDLTNAAGGVAAGVRGEQELSFVQGQLRVCESLADDAVLEYAALHSAAVVSSATSCLTDPDQTAAGSKVPLTDTGGLTSALADLDRLERQTLAAQRTSFWLHPLRFVWLLLAPAIVMLLLLIGTAHLLARYFRRFVSPLLLAATAVTAAVAVVVSVLSARDDGRLSANPWAAHPLTMALEGALLIGALLLIHFGYRPRLAEYRFRPR